MVLQEQGCDQVSRGNVTTLKLPYNTDLEQENWVERTDNPPPKNAVWMLNFFQVISLQPQLCEMRGGVFRRIRTYKPQKVSPVTEVHPPTSKQIIRQTSS